MNKECANADHEHQARPKPADGAMRRRALRSPELHDAKRESRHRRKGMQLDRGLADRSGRRVIVTPLLLPSP